MSRQIFLTSQLNESLKMGIVCLKDQLDDKEEYSHFFFTRNKEIIEKFNDGFYERMQYGEAFDILNRKVTKLEPSLFTGSIHEVAVAAIPDESLDLKDAFVYIGNKTGAIVVSELMLTRFKDEPLENFGIQDDDKHSIIPVCLGIENETLEDIYLVKA